MRFLIIISLIITTFTGYTKAVKVVFSYNMQEVTVVYNDQVFKHPEYLNINFELGGKLIFFKQGYQCQYIKIPKDSTFKVYKVTLEAARNYVHDKNVSVDLKKVVFINYVSNFTTEEVTEIIKSKLSESNINAVTTNSVFTNVSANASKFSIGAEVVKSDSKNGSFSSPYYLSSFHRIRWLVVDNISNKLVLEFQTQGFYMVYFKSQKGIVSSERLKEITIHSIEEACQELINSEEFVAVLKQ